MRKLLYIAIGMLFFSSCEKNEEELTSLEGTIWKVRTYYDNGEWGEDKFTFTATHVTFLGITDDGHSATFTGTYTFDPPEVMIISNDYAFGENEKFETPEIHHKGTVSGNIMKLEFRPLFGDIIINLELKRQ